MVRYKVRFHAAAERDLDDVLVFLAPSAGADIATHFVDRIVDYCLSFGSFPERGTRRDDIARGLRTVGWRRRATIAFTVENETVVILRILYAGRSLELPEGEEE